MVAEDEGPAQKKKKMTAAEMKDYMAAWYQQHQERLRLKRLEKKRKDAETEAAAVAKPAAKSKKKSAPLA